MAKTTSLTKITLAKDQYYPGEEIVVHIDCDNTKCAKAVKNFKVKLRRHLLALGYNGKLARSKKYVAEIKVAERCDAHASKQLDLKL